MKQLTLRLTDEMYLALKELAAAHYRSLQKELEALIDAASTHQDQEQAKEEPCPVSQPFSC